MVKQTYAPYSALNGWCVFPHFFKYESVREYCFLLKGDLDKLQKTCDAWFKEPSNGAIDMRAASNLVIVSIVDCRTAHRKAYILDEDQRKVGNIKFYQINISLLLQSAQTLDNYLFTPYRFVNNSILMVNERELLGLPTAGIDIHFTPSIDETAKDASLPSMHALFYPNYHNLNDITQETLISLSQVRDKPEKPGTAVLPPEKVVDALAALVEAHRLQKPSPSLIDPLTYVTQLITKQQCLNFKQYRELNNSAIALDQSIFTYKANGFRLRAGGVLNQDHEIRFPVPQAGDNYINIYHFHEWLGVEPVNLATHAFWFESDYQLAYDRDLWNIHQTNV